MWVAPNRALDIVWRDMLFILLMVFLMLAIFANPPDSGKEIASPGVLVVEIRWPDSLPVDVDLWVKAPGDIPVGYYKRAGEVFNLLRDDLGMMRDQTVHNYEYSFARSTPDGEYIVTVHLYNSNTWSDYPLPVDAKIYIVGPTKAAPQEVLFETVYLLSQGHEVTVARFTLQDGELVPGSINQIPAAHLNRFHTGHMIKRDPFLCGPHFNDPHEALLKYLNDSHFFGGLGGGVRT